MLCSLCLIVFWATVCVPARMNPAKSMVLSVRKCYALVFHSSHPIIRTTLASLSKYDHRFLNMQ